MTRSLVSLSKVLGSSFVKDIELVKLELYENYESRQIQLYETKNTSKRGQVFCGISLEVIYGFVASANSRNKVID